MNFKMQQNKTKVFYDEKWFRNEKVEVPGKPIQLIIQDPLNGKLKINEKALEIIRNIDGNIGICAIVGPYRTGKSFIKNLFLNRRNGFDLGQYNKACTKGIWMWDTPIKHRNKNGEFSLILLDTEGLGSPQASNQHDNKIFILSLLLSSLFIYNTKNALDRNNLKQLAIISNLSQYINSSLKKIDSNSNNNLIYNSPDFIWVIRDYFLKSTSTHREYLLNNLEPEVNTNDENEVLEANFIREAIKTTFKSLDCICLPIPIDKGVDNMSFDESLRKLDDVDFENLRLEFREGIQTLCNNIKETICPKTLFGLPLSGIAFSKYIEEVFAKIESNEQVSLADSLASSIKYASEKSLKDALDSYKKTMDEYIKINPMPLRWDTLDYFNKESIENSFKLLKMSLNGSDEITKPYLEKFSNEIYVYENNDDKLKIVGGLYNEYRIKNSEKIKDFNKKEIKKLWKRDIVEIYLNNETRHYNNDSNISDEFLQAYELLKKNYFAKAFYGIEPEMTEAFNEWYEDKDIMSIINNFKFLNDQIKINIKNDVKLLEENAKFERVNRDNDIAILRMNETYKNMESIINELKEIMTQQADLLQTKVENKNGVFANVCELLDSALPVITAVLPLILKL